MDREREKTAVSSSHGDNQMGILLRAGIRAVILIVLLGWALIWFMMPTNTFKKQWLPKIRQQSNYSTFFESEGTPLLMYTFPILFVAALGCVYIHLKKNQPAVAAAAARKQQQGLVMVKRPVIVKGPLGIVSWIELSFFTMFIGLLIWSYSSYLHNKFINITPASAATDGEKMWESKLESGGLYLGIVGNVCLALVFFPVTRGSSVLPVLGLTSESSIKYHIWIGHILMSLFTAHGLCYIIYWAATNEISQMLEWAKTDVSNVAGELALFFGLMMWATTFPLIRRKFFELFFYTHYLYILFMLFFIFHVGISYACIMLPGFYLFLLDRYIRFLQSRRRVRLVSARLLPCQTLELNFSKNPGLKYNPTSTMFINVPSISKLQWHPFTITSNSNLEPEKLSVVIKGEGAWSTSLYQSISSSPSSIDHHHHLQVSVEGPYGPISSQFHRYDALVMVSGGSGIAPFISIIKELIYITKSSNSPIPKIHLISSFKTSSELTMLDLILPISGDDDISGVELQIDAYVTREKLGEQPIRENNITSSPSIRTVFFKSHPKDSPISAILGPNGWLWLAAIICSSFVIFLILIGLVTRYYIYPRDQNKSHNFSLPLRAFFNMLFICFSIVIAASGAVLWNKKKLAREVGQIQNIEGFTPTGSPSQKHETELESFPFQSLAQSINVTYGERPNLKRILVECKGSNVGVLVSGPKKMRQDVAAICSSALVENLHFESISFTW